MVELPNNASTNDLPSKWGLSGTLNLVEDDDVSSSMPMQQKDDRQIITDRSERCFPIQWPLDKQITAAFTEPLELKTR